MLPMTVKTMVVVGGSRGVGRRIVEAAAGNGVRVLAVARQTTNFCSQPQHTTFVGCAGHSFDRVVDQVENNLVQLNPMADDRR